MHRGSKEDDMGIRRWLQRTSNYFQKYKFIKECMVLHKSTSYE